MLVTKLVEVLKARSGATADCSDGLYGSTACSRRIAYSSTEAEQVEAIIPPA